MDKDKLKISTLNDILKNYIQGLPRDRKLIELYRYIKSGQIASKDEITSVFGFTERSITDYLHSLGETWGVGITFNHKTQKYEVTSDSEKLKSIKAANMLTPVQVVTILFALNNSSSFLAEEMNMIKEKLIQQLNKREQKIIERYLIKADFSRSIEDRKQLENFKKIRQAILQGNRINITVQGNEVNKTPLDPISFDYQHGNYYLIGCGTSKSYYYINISNIKFVEITNKKHYFDCSNTVVQDMKLNTWYGVTGDNVTVRIKIDNQGKKLMEHRRGLINISLIEVQDDYEIIDITANGLDGIRAWLLGFAEHVEVIEPLELRKELIEIAQRIRENYNH